LFQVSLPAVIALPTIHTSGIEADGTCTDERISKNVSK
jgi:hypothetical protein